MTEILQADALLAILPHQEPEWVVNTRNDLVDIDARLRRADPVQLLMARRAARVTEWHMADRWPSRQGGGPRNDDRPTLGRSNVADRVAWQAVYAVGARVLDWILAEQHAEHLTQQWVIERGDCIDGNDDEWYTPAWLFDALDLSFDLDACAPFDRTHVATPATRFLTLADDGLTGDWDGLVWCNPPYSNPEPWARRMIDHGNGILLAHVPINGLWCLDVWWRCSGLRLLQGMEFVRPSGDLRRPGYWLQLAGFGDLAGEAIRRMNVDDRVRDRYRPSPAWMRS